MTFSLIFNLSVSFSPQNTTPHLSSALRSACCDQPGGRSPFTHNVVTVCISLSLVTLIRTAKLCVCVYVCSCCFSTSSFFLFLFFSRVSLPNICHPHTPSFPPHSPLTLLAHKEKKPIPLVAMGIGCHGAARFSCGPCMYVCVCVYVYCSVTEFGCHVDWE